MKKLIPHFIRYLKFGKYYLQNQKPYFTAKCHFQANFFFISNVRLTRAQPVTGSGNDVVADSYKHSNGIQVL